MYTPSEPTFSVISKLKLGMAYAKQPSQVREAAAVALIRELLAEELHNGMEGLTAPPLPS